MSFHSLFHCFQSSGKVYTLLIHQKRLFKFISLYDSFLPRQSRFCKENFKLLFMHIQSRNYVLSTGDDLKDIPASVEVKENPLENFHSFDQQLNREFGDFQPLAVPFHSNSFADFVNSSKALQTLLMFGVNLSIVNEKFPECQQFLVTLDLNSHLRPKLEFLKDVGVTAAEFGEVLTRNPMILDPKFPVDDLQEITDYLKSKRFKKEEIASLVVRYPYVFNLSVPKLDGVLGFYQKLPTNYENRTIYYSGKDLRSIIIKCPHLINASLDEVYLIVKTLERSCQFTVAQMRHLFLERPQMLIMDQKKLELLYKYYANEMQLTNEQIAKNPFLFDIRLKILKPRHCYLKALGRDLYDERMPGYQSLHNIVCSTNEEFCRKCQLGPLSDFEKFLRTI